MNRANITQPFTSQRQQRLFNLTEMAWLLVISGIAALIALVMILTGPSPAMIAWLIYGLGAAAILARPRYGLYLLLFFGLAGDGTLSPWFPFTKGFSSRESLLFVNDAIIISPLETYLALMFISWFLRSFTNQRIPLRRSEQFWPVLIFLFFVITGLVYGVGKGGDLTIALWQARPLFYMVACYLLSSSLLEKREHVQHLITAAMLGLLYEAISGNFFYFVTLQGSLSGIESITDHTAATRMNTVFVLALCLWMYKTSWVNRAGITLMVPFTLITYLATQRRAAMVALFGALFLLALVLWIENRKAFILIIPPLLIAAAIYLAAFWNSSGALGLPARAIKSSLSDNQVSMRDASSNAYRTLEDINTNFTVRQRPITGIGFGQKFYVIVPMADISIFEWWQYFPHNSIIWIWLTMGVFGFIAMLYLVGSAIMHGAQVFRRMPRNELRAIALMGTLYLVMHFIFATVDISWDTESMIYIGAIMGMLNTLEEIVAKPAPRPDKRWPWQPDPEPTPGLVE